jgi:hypothetical protein
MSTWTTDQLDHIGTAEELEITTRRADGSLRGWVPIWVVRVDGDLYVRSYRGTAGTWFRYATASGSARIRAGGLERDITIADPAEPSVHQRIDAVCRHKYGRYGGSSVSQMTSRSATAATVRLIPT